MKQWGEKRYYSLDYYLKQTYGEKIYKISLNAGLTCPNRDGTVGTGGCIFCSDQGSGDFAGCPTESVTEQLQKGKAVLRDKRPVHSYIAYFQAFTNTYAPLDRLESLYMEAVQDPDVKILSIATRPDCLSKDILSLLSRINKIKPVWIELGLQTIHPASAAYIRSCLLYTSAQIATSIMLSSVSFVVRFCIHIPGLLKSSTNTLLLFPANLMIS